MKDILELAGRATVRLSNGRCSQPAPAIQSARFDVTSGRAFLRLWR